MQLTLKIVLITFVLLCALFPSGLGCLVWYALAPHTFWQRAFVGLVELIVFLPLQLKGIAVGIGFSISLL